MSDALTTRNATDHDRCPMLLWTVWCVAMAYFRYGHWGESLGFTEFLFFFVSWKADPFTGFGLSDGFLLMAEEVFPALLARSFGLEMDQNATIPPLRSLCENATLSQPKVATCHHQIGISACFDRNWLCSAVVSRIHLDTPMRWLCLRNQAATEHIRLVGL